ncbi:hypothetical protein N7492_009775 [Penicillium capsulatum]|uniref:J domain-containing protein n=1 Tax=Penicillium capsulatum TaxID=69766 RepID=A0A9W9LFU1_9EURO|nr:hypothetical protein N7492_009775 [Penicillium capsulatum]KAJ6114143.1 hypothetical protein N7512_007588 [Penicillium capsulatum]
MEGFGQDLQGDEPSGDHYAVLQIPHTASEQDIKTAWRRLCRKLHPDKNLGEEDIYKTKFQAVQTAYEVLKDPAKRRDYDKKRDYSKAKTMGTDFNKSQPGPQATGTREWPSRQKPNRTPQAKAQTQPKQTPFDPYYRPFYGPSHDPFRGQNKNPQAKAQPRPKQPPFNSNYWPFYGSFQGPFRGQNKTPLRNVNPNSWYRAAPPNVWFGNTLKARQARTSPHFTAFCGGTGKEWTEKNQAREKSEQNDAKSDTGSPSTQATSTGSKTSGESSSASPADVLSFLANMAANKNEIDGNTLSQQIYDDTGERSLVWRRCRSSNVDNY